MSADTTQIETEVKSGPRAAVVFISHGGGPCFFMDAPNSMFAEMDKNSATAQAYRDLATTYHLKPEDGIKGLLIISGHWETSNAVEVLAAEHHDLYYDYYGFPDEMYHLEWPAFGDPKLADRVLQLLNDAGIEAKANRKRGYDHGVFIPMKLAYPEPSIPILQLSLLSSLDPQKHYEIGQALQPLRDEGILIIGSGSTTHNLSRMGDPSVSGKAREFTKWLKDLFSDESLSSEERSSMLINAPKLCPHYKLMHPRTEHFAPIFVAAGAANASTAKPILDWTVLHNLVLTGFLFK